MTGNVSTKPPVWFWVLSVLALLWNLLGVMAYLGNVYMTDEMKASLPPEQLELMESTPSWVMAAFAIAVWAGLLGCIGLLLRKKWAKALLALSLIGILAQMIHGLFMTNSAEVYGQVQGMMIPISTIIIGIALVLFARMAHRRQWIT